MNSFPYRRSVPLVYTVCHLAVRVALVVVGGLLASFEEGHAIHRRVIFRVPFMCFCDFYLISSCGSGSGNNCHLYRFLPLIPFLFVVL